ADSRPDAKGSPSPKPQRGEVTPIGHADRHKFAIGHGKPPLRTALRIVVEFWPRHADLRSRGWGDRLSSRAIAGAARTYGLVRRPRSGARAALPGKEKHHRGNGSERAKPARNREDREGLPAYH